MKVCSDRIGFNGPTESMTFQLSPSNRRNLYPLKTPEMERFAPQELPLGAEDTYGEPMDWLQ